MTVDVATLQFEFKSDSALTAAERMDVLIAKGDKLEAQQKRIRLATDMAGASHKTATGQVDRAVQANMALAQSGGAVEKSLRQGIGTAADLRALRALDARQMKEVAAQQEAAAAEQAAVAKARVAATKAAAAERAAAERTAAQAVKDASAEVRAARALEAAAQRELVLAANAYQRDQERAAAAAIQAARDQAQAVAALKASVDPLAAAQDRVNAELEEATRLYKLGAISAAEYGNAFRVLDSRLDQLRTGHVQGAASAKLQAHELANLSFQLQDVIVSLASGQKPMMVAVQQGSQIGQVFQGAAARGVTFKEAVLGIAQAAGRFLLAWAPVIGVVGAIIGAFLLWRKHLDDVKAATKATAEATKNHAEVQASTRDALGSAVEFADKYAVANAGVAKSLDAVLASQSAAYRETMAGIGATDAAGQAAVRRAELERLATVAILKRAAAEATARAAESDAAVKKARGAAQGSGLFVAFGLAGSPEMMAGAQQAEAAKFKKMGGDAAAQAAKQEREYAKTLNDSADALMKATLVIPPATKATVAHGAAVKAAATNTDDFDRALRQLLESLETPAEKAAREYAENITLLGKGLAAGKITLDEYREAFDRLNPVVVDAKEAQKAWNAEMLRTPSDLKPATGALEGWIADMEEAVRKYQDVQRAGDELFNGIRNRDWAQAFAGLLRALDEVRNATSKTDKAMAALALADAAGNAIGGKGGRALSSASGAAATAFTASGGNPYVAAAAAVVAGLSELLKSKPSNEGAGYSLVTGALTGKSRTADTEQAVKAAGGIISGGQDLLRNAGLTLNETIHGLVIGSRDLSQIYTTGGRTVTAAVGDVAAAADAGLRAVLETATYASAEQEKLAKSALAAGKSFDDVMAILDKYAQAQAISGNLADQILHLTNPQAYDTKAVQDDIAAQRKAYQQLATDGYLTASQLEAINAQLAQLEGLKLDEVLKRYGSAAQSAAEENAANIDKLKSDVLDAYETFSQAKRAEIDALRQAEQGLKAFRKELDFGALAGRGPVSQLAATRREFDRLTALDAANPERLANLQSVSQAFLEASRAASPTELAFNRDLAAVKRATEASQLAAGAQADIAQQQLDAATAQLAALGLLNTTTLDLATTIKAYLAATGGQGAANDNAVDVARYLKANPDLAVNWAENGIMRSLGGTLEEAVRAQYAGWGKNEIAQGLRTYATGGSHPGGMRLVGEEGPELEVTGPSRIYSARDTARMMGGDNAELISEVRALRAEVTALRGPTERTASAAKSMDDRGRKQEFQGIYVRGETPDEPVKTQAA